MLFDNHFCSEGIGSNTATGIDPFNCSRHDTPIVFPRIENCVSLAYDVTTYPTKQQHSF
jgi:hypothetical protein